MASPLTISLKVVGLEQAKADLKDFGTIGKRSFDELQTEAKQLSESAATTDRAVAALANRVRQLAAQNDPLAASNIKLRGTLVDLDRALAKELISLEQHGTLTAFVKRQNEEFATSLVTAASATTQLTGELTRTASNLSALQAKFDPATASAKRMGAELAELNQAQRAGVTIAGGYQAAWDGIIAKYDEAAAAAKRAKEAQAQLIADARAAQNATTSQNTFNTQLGVDRARSGSARESASVFEEVFAAEEEAQRAAERLAATVEALTAKFNPATASARAMAAEIAELNLAAKLGVEITGGYQAALDGIIAKYDEGAQAASRQAAALAKLKEEQLASNAAADAARAQTGLNQSLGVNRPAGGSSAAESARAFEDAFAAAQKYKDQLAPITALERNRQTEIAKINELNRAGLLDNNEKDASILRTNKIYDEQAKLIQKNSGQSIASTAQVRFAVQQLGFQINDVATQLASGTSPLTILIQQGGQFIQAFTAGGGVVNTLKAFGTSILGMINPMTLLVGSVAAVGAGIAFLAFRASETEARLRQFNVVLDGMGTSSQATALQLEEVSKSLQHTGTSAEDAQKAVLAFTRQQNINPAFAGQITALARDISAVTGKDFIQVTQEIARAIATDTEEVIKLAQALAGPNGLPAATTKAMRELAKIGDPGGAAMLGIKALEDRFGGAFQKNLSDTAKTMNSIGEAWDNMLTKLSKTTIVQGARDAIIGFLNGIANAVSSTPEPYKSPADRAVEDANRIRKLYSSPPMTPEEEAKVRAQYTTLSGTGGALAPGSALVRANTANKDIAGLNAELAARLNAYFQEFPDKTIRSAARIGEHPSEFNPGGTGLHNRDILGAGVAADIGGLYGPDPNLARFGLRQNVPGDWRHVEPIEIPSAAAATAAARMEAARQFNQIYGGGALTGTGATATRVPGTMVSGVFPPAPTAAPITPAGLNQEQLGILAEGVRQQDLLTAATKAFGTSNREAQIWLQAYTAAIGTSADTEFNRTKAMQAANGAIERHRIELSQTAETERIAADLATKTGQAFGTDEVAGLKAAAAAQAQLAGRQGQLADANLILRTQAAEAIEATGKAIPGLVQQTKASERLAEAAKQGAGAEHEMSVQNQVTAATHNVLTKALATGDPALIARAKALRDLTEAQIKANDAAQQQLIVQQRINERKDQIALVQQGTALVGQLPETIDAANAKLQEQQKLLAQDLKLTDDISVKSLANVDALNKANIAHAEALRQQQRIDDMYRQIGSTIESALGSVLDSVFDKKKAIDWGAQVKTMLRSLVTGIASNLFIKPLTGTILGALGASPNVVSQYGGFGGFGVGGLFGGGGGLFKELGIDTGSGGGLLSGTSSFMNKSVGGIFGTVQTEGWIPGANGIWTNATTGATTDIAGISNITPGVLGSTTLGTAIGSVGLGFTAGTMLNSVVGGKSTGGMIGSGVGSLAGMAIGSMIGMPWLGALIGGAGGGLLGGMFGNSKPSNQSSGANIDLSQFKITSGFSGGNQQIDQQVQQLGQGLQSFLDLLKTTGGALSGNVLLQSGVNTGITVDSSLEGYKGRYNLGKDTDAALKIMEQALIKSVTGVSEVMKTVLSQVGTDEDIAKAITFAKTYDTLKTAADSAFSTVEDASKKMGPFSTAMQQINAIFADLTVSATRFGLSLDPINQALDEATKRLQGDFLKAVDTALNEASQKGFINSIQTVLDDYFASTKEASDIGLTDRATGDKLGTVFMDQVQNVLDSLNDDQLKEVILHFQGFNSVIADLAVTEMNTNDATVELNTSLQDLAKRADDARKGIQSYIDQITATAGPSVSPENAFLQAQREFSLQYSKAQGGDVTALEDITQYADRLQQGIAGYYGSSKEGNDLFNQMVAQLQTLVALTPTPFIDPGFQTNQLIGTLTDTVQQTSTTSNNVSTANSNTQIANNNAVAASIIAQNNANSDTLYGVVNDTAAQNIANNQESTAALIATATDNTTATIAANDAASAAAIAQNNTNAAALVQSNTDTTAASLAKADDTTAQIVATNNMNAGQVIAASQLTGQQLLDQAETASAAALADNQAATAEVISQNNAATAQLITTTQATTDQIVTAADAASIAALVAANENTAASLAKADEVTAASVAAANDNTAAALAKADETTAMAVAAADVNANAIVTAVQGYGTATVTAVTDYGSATVTAIQAYGGATVTAIQAYGGAIVNSLSASGGGTDDTIAAWGSANVTATNNAANSVIGTLGNNTNTIVYYIDYWSKAIFNQIANWSSSIVTTITNNSNAIISTIANWVGTEINNIVQVGNNSIASNTGLANSIIQTIYNAANSINLTLQNWIGSQINNDTVLTNSLINVGATYSNANTIATYDAANSIVSADLQYSNSIIGTIANWGLQNYNMAAQSSSYIYSAYMAQDYFQNTAISQRQDMVNKLQQMINLLNLLVNRPY